MGTEFLVQQIQVLIAENYMVQKLFRWVWI